MTLKEFTDGLLLAAQMKLRNATKEESQAEFNRVHTLIQERDKLRGYDFTGKSVF